MRTLEDLNAAYRADSLARTFSKSVYAAYLASRYRISHLDALRTLPGTESYVKTAIAAETTGNLSALAQSGEAYAFRPLLQRREIPGQIGAFSVPPNVLVPTATSDPVFAWVAEGASIPAGRIELNAPRTSTAQLGCIRGQTEELFRMAGDAAVSFCEADTLRVVPRGVNSKFLSDDAAVAGVSPAGILNGLTAVGSGSPSSIADLEQLWSAVSDGDPDRPYFVCSPRGAMWLAAQNVDGLPTFPNVSAATGGTIAGVELLLAKGAGANLILLDGAQFVITDEGLTVEPSRFATLQLVDNPTNNAATGVATNMISMFQTNTAAVKYIRYLSWLKLTTDCVQFIELPIAGSPA